jgi:hypothetical protein
MAIQLLVLNHVYLGGYVMPMLYVLFVLMLPTDMGRIPMLLTAFGTGFLVDVMNNMLGFHALACALLAMMRILFADRILMLKNGKVTACEPPARFVVSDNAEVREFLAAQFISEKSYLEAKADYEKEQ